MFRWFGKLFRLWEMYLMVTTFSPLGFAIDKAMEYIFERMRPRDWVFVGAAALLALVWVAELLNWVVQVILAIVRGVTGWHGFWPHGPLLSTLAHPSGSSLLWWIFTLLLLLVALIRWLSHFAAHLWRSRPAHFVAWTSASGWRGGAARFESSAGPGTDTEPTRPGAAMEARTAPGLLPGTVPLVLAWVAQWLLFR
ncbi:MAG: hypothetical protein K6T78_10340 [Alicyclobacillus sp.]|nr:hypothetical protein [Alicyclobacillus sp.]